MKRILCLIMGYGFFVAGFTQSENLSISKNKTTSLIFPYTIRHVDRGTKDILVQQIKEADNILLVKAATESFTETNLSVVTDDGSVYSFIVNFNSKPPVWVYHLPVINKQTIAAYANGILDNPKRIKGIKDRNRNIKAQLTGIYIKEAVIYYQLHLTNNSPIDYDIEFIRFYIRDKKKGKRTAIQEIELKPLHISGNTTIIKGKGQNIIVAALEKFTIPDAKFLAVQVMEKNGGRHMLLRIDNRNIMQATTLPDYK